MQGTRRSVRRAKASGHAHGLCEGLSSEAIKHSVLTQETFSRFRNCANMKVTTSTDQKLRFFIAHAEFAIPASGDLKFISQKGSRPLFIPPIAAGLALGIF